MEENRQNGGFQYTYSATEQDEIKKIREKYTVRTEDTDDKLSRVRQLDRNASNKATVFSLVFGIIGSLILGTGMSLAMTEFSAILGAHSEYGMLIGVAVGMLGCVLAILAYPVYKLVLSRERKKVSAEILRLTDELLK